MVWKSTPYRFVRSFALLVLALFSFSFSFSQAPPAGTSNPPVLVVQSASNAFSRYTAEILRAEGLNEFNAAEVTQLDAATLSKYDVVIVGEMPLTAAVVSLLTNWTNAGGTLIAFKPDPQLASLLGITPAAGSLSNQYLLVNTSAGPGAGIVNQTIQFHGAADLYTLNGATSLATLYSNATTATSNPAVTTRAVGSNGGRAIAFTYDLSKSVVYTRQGNPAWAGQKRDGTQGPIRSDDLFFGQGSESHWIDFDKIAIPQADEQQHLLTNIILQSNLHRKPLPRFWFLPKGYKAAVVMTGDDHNNNATTPRFNQYLAQGSNTPQDIADWKAVRATSYIWLGTPITDAQAKAFDDQGFEIAIHLNTGPGGCQDYTAATYQNDLSNQMTQFAALFPSLASSVSNRTHCIAWSDWATQPKVQAKNGIRLDANYYYWPGAWIQNRPGMFTGSGMPMRFADLDGSLIDCYQVATQIVDEAGINYSTFTNALLDKAVGPEGYYGVFCAQMHTDTVNHEGSNIIVAAAKARGIPVIAARQMLTWLDGRNNSSFSNMSWSNDQLNFTITKATGAHGLKTMLPLYSDKSQLLSISTNGAPVSYYIETIKGIAYAFFDVAATGDYIANYGVDNAAPVISDIVATPHADGTATITWNTNEASDSKVDYGTSSTLGSIASNGSQIAQHSVTLSGLQPGVIYYFRVSSKDAAGNATTAPAPPAAPLSFVMPAGPCFVDQTLADFKAGTADVNTTLVAEGDGGVMLKPVLNEEFSGTSIPAGWTEGVFNPGSTTVANGSVVVNGTHIFSNNTYTPGTSLEFTATFNQGNFQNIGFSANQPFDVDPWVTIGQGTADGKLYARAWNGTTISLGTTLLGSPHKYRINWNAANIEFYVDDNTVPAARMDLAIAANMYLQISDVNNNDGALSVDWMRASPYASPGEFTSRVFDAGSKKEWGLVAWTAAQPAGTSIAIDVRTGDTPAPDNSWSSYSTVTAPGGNVGRTSRYIQYKATLNSTDTKFTPVLKDISISCSGTTSGAAPVVIDQPASQAVCAGNKVKFESVAKGTPAPTVQWQQSADGVNWTNISGATSNELVFATVSADNQKQYRAVWTNSEGAVNSSAAVLTVNPIPVLSSSLTAETTSGTPFTYTAASTTRGVSFSWTRAAVSGISNPAASGTGNIGETLVNTTNTSVKVSYLYTLAANGCSNAQELIVTVNPPEEEPGCKIAASIAANFNGISISAGRYIWFNSVFKPRNLGTGPVTFNVTNSKITFTANNQLFVLNVPDAQIRFASNSSAKTEYVNNAWSTTAPSSTNVNVFLTGLSYKVPANLPGNIKNVVWSADISIDKPGAAFDWKWTAGVYNNFAPNAGLNVKTTDGLLNILNPLLGVGNAGTPLNYLLNIIPGAMGAGLLNVVSTYSAQQSLTCTFTQGGRLITAGRSSTLQASRMAAALDQKEVTKLELNASPNPSNNYFRLAIRAKQGPVTIRILDMLGRVVETHTKTGGISSLELGHGWKTGTYFAELLQGGEKVLVKMIKIN